MVEVSRPNIKVISPVLVQFGMIPMVSQISCHRQELKTKGTKSTTTNRIVVTLSLVNVVRLFFLDPQKDYFTFPLKPTAKLFLWLKLWKKTRKATRNANLNEPNEPRDSTK